MYKQDYIKLKGFYIAMKTTNKMKRQWENIVTNDISNKGLTSKIYKELLQFSIKKDKQTFQLKNGQGTQIDILPRHTDGQQAHEKMINFTTHQGNAN